MMLKENTFLSIEQKRTEVWQDVEAYKHLWSNGKQLQFNDESETAQNSTT